MTKSTITREESVQAVFDLKVGYRLGFADIEILKRVARMALAAMDCEPVAENIRIADALEGLLWPNMAIGNKAVIQEAIEALRAYHAQPAPVVPGKWIPVSERMPEDRTQVILWDAEIGEVTSGHYSHKTQTFYHCGDAIENEITHWMPPPCAPQEPSLACISKRSQHLS